MIAYALNANELANNLFGEIVWPLVLLMVTVAFLLFIIGSIKNLSSLTTSPAERSTMIKRTIWMLVGLFILVSIPSIQRVIGNLVGSSAPSEAEVQNLRT